MRCGLVVWPVPMCGWLRDVRVWSVNSINCEYNQPKKINKIIHYSYAMSQSQVVRQFEVAKMLFDFKTLAGNCQVNKKKCISNESHSHRWKTKNPSATCMSHSQAYTSPTTSMSTSLWFFRSGNFISNRPIMNVMAMRDECYLFFLISSQCNFKFNSISIFTFHLARQFWTFLKHLQTQTQIRTRKLKILLNFSGAQHQKLKNKSKNDRTRKR